MRRQIWERSKKKDTGYRNSMWKKDTGASIEKRTTEYIKTSNTGENTDKKEEKMQRIIEGTKKWNNEIQIIWTANAEKRKGGWR